MSANSTQLKMAPNTTTPTLSPYIGSFTYRHAAHLLKRTTFGARNADIKAFVSKGLNFSVLELLRPDKTPSPPVRMVPTWPTGEYGDDYIKVGDTFVNENNYNYYRFLYMRVWWMKLMINQGRGITEKMVHFLQNLVPTSWESVQEARFVYKTHMLYRKYALGNYKEFIKEVTVDPGMLLYLNGNYNDKNNPDENYARELQELFCIGKGPDSGYTQDDVIAAAKILTGWRVDWANNTNYFAAYAHSTGDKKFSAYYNNKIISGKSGDAGKEETTELINMIFEQNEVAKHIVRKLYIYFVQSEISDSVETNIITPLANIFRSNNYNFKPVLEKLLLSKHFFDESVMGAIIKSPTDLLVGSIRTLGIQLIPQKRSTYNYCITDLPSEADFWNHQSIVDHCSYLGMNMMAPPNVAGWPAYHQQPLYYKCWITADSLAWREYIMSACKNPPGGFYHYPNIKADWMKYIASFSTPSNPAKLVQELCWQLLSKEVPEATRISIKNEFLLYKSTNDLIWTNLWNNYLKNPSDQNIINDITNRFSGLLGNILNSPDYHLM